MLRAVSLSLVLALLGGCVNADNRWSDWDGGGDGYQPSVFDTIPGLISLSILPKDATITQELNNTKQATFKVMGLFASGEKDVTPQANLSLYDSTLGYFSGGLLTPTKNLGGKTMIIAKVGSLSTTTTLTLKVRTSVVAVGAPSDSATRFKNPCTGGSALKVAYPEAGAMVPPNLADFSVMWVDAASDLWEVSLQSETAEVKLYTINKKHRFSHTVWQLLAYSNLAGTLTLTVRGAKQADATKCAQSSQQQVLVGPAEIKGGIYYWVTTPDNAIMRYDFGQAEKKPESFVSEKSIGYCVGCHAISPDGTRLAFTDNQDFGDVMEVKTKKLFTDKTKRKHANRVYFQAFTPDNRYLISSYLGRMSVRDGASGKDLGTMDLGGPASQPEISPAGDALVFVRPGDQNGGLNFKGGTIATAPLSGIKVGKPKLLVEGGYAENNYYPSFSPDGEWIIFNRVKERSYSNDEAELWVVPTAGGTPIQLKRANQGKKLRNSWARWSPFTQLVSGRKLFWFSFSSIRDYGTELSNSTRGIQNAIPQIWMTAFDPELAKAGKDPGYPAFWLPYQDLTSKNHLAQWTKKVPVVN